METNEGQIARVYLSNDANRTVIQVDGKTPKNIEAFTLYQHVGEPATLDLRRVLTESQAKSRGVEITDSIPREDVRITLARVEIEGVVLLLDDAMRAAREQGRGTALDSFMMASDGGLAYRLGDILADAARYRAIRIYLESTNGGNIEFDGIMPVPSGDDGDEERMYLVDVNTGRQLDTIADALRAHVRGDDGFEPFDPLGDPEHEQLFARTVDVDGVLHRPECNAVRSPSDIVENITKPCNCGAITAGTTA